MINIEEYQNSLLDMSRTSFEMERLKMIMEQNEAAIKLRLIKQVAAERYNINKQQWAEMQADGEAKIYQSPDEFSRQRPSLAESVVKNAVSGTIKRVRELTIEKLREFGQLKLSDLYPLIRDDYPMGLEPYSKWVAKWLNDGVIAMTFKRGTRHYCLPEK